MVALRLAMVLAIMPAVAAAQESQVQDPNADVAAFERYDSENSFPADATLFVGSSSINLWRTTEAFPDRKVINRGFGGSTARELLTYQDKLIFKYSPRDVVIYTGENDIFLGTDAPEVITLLTSLLDNIRRRSRCARIFYISIKPSSSRWDQVGRQRAVNKAIQDHALKSRGFEFVDLASSLLGADGRPDDTLYQPDKLHLNEAGYRLWNAILNRRLREEGIKPRGC